ARYLARPDAAAVAIIGAGAQAVTQLLGLDQLFDLEQVRVYDVNSAQTDRYIERVKPRLQGSPALTAAGSPADAVREADLVVCATTSERPVFSGDDLAPGAHVNGVGSYTPKMRELDETTFLRAGRVVVDSREACWSEAGDLIQPVNEGTFDRDIVDAEIGEIINGDCHGRTAEEEITVFKAVGLAVLDAAAAHRAYRRAREMGIGQEADLLS
ncbi:MAG: ornithine cyclodeaminase family protein, partial [Bacillota bacterium]